MSRFSPFKLRKQPNGKWRLSGLFVTPYDYSSWADAIWGMNIILSVWRADATL